MSAPSLNNSVVLHNTSIIQLQHPAVNRVFSIPELMLRIFFFLTEDADKKRVIPVSRFFCVMGIFANFNRIYSDKSLEHSISRESIETVRRLIAGYFSPRGTITPSISHLSQHALPFSCLIGDAALTKLILEKDEVTCGKNVYRAVKLALEKREFDGIMTLLKDGRFDPSFEDNYLIRTVIEHGNLALLRELLFDERVTPSAKDNSPLKTACEKGYSEQAELLLKSPRLSLSEADRDLIVIASKSGDVQIVSMLLNDKRVDFSKQIRKAIEAAHFAGHADVLKALLTHSNTEDSFLSDTNQDKFYDKVLYAMSGKGHLAVVELLLENPNIRPEGGAPIRAAVTRGHPEVVKTLLNAGLVDDRFNGEVPDSVEKHPQVLKAIKNTPPRPKFTNASDAKTAIEKLLTANIEDTDETETVIATTEPSPATTSSAHPEPAPLETPIVPDSAAPQPKIPTQKSETETVIAMTESSPATTSSVKPESAPLKPRTAAPKRVIPPKKSEKTIFQTMFGFVSSLFSPVLSLFRWLYKKLF